MITQLSVRLADRSGRPLAEVRSFMSALFDRARREYLVAGAPLGWSDEAFLVWLDVRCAGAGARPANGTWSARLGLMWGG
jgi:hypothetical protein